MNAFRAALVLGLALLVAPAAAQERIEFGPFYYRADTPAFLFLDGIITENAAQLLWENIEYLRDGTTLVLNSTEGTLVSALTVAEMARAARVNTAVPANAVCAGPCFFILMAGIARTVEGTVRLEVVPDPIADRYMSPEMLWSIQTDLLVRYGASPALSDLFAGLEGGGLRILLPQEIDRLGVDRSRTDGEAQTASVPPLHPVPLEIPETTIEPADEAMLPAVILRDRGSDNVERSLAWTSWYVAELSGQPLILSSTFTPDMRLAVVVRFFSEPASATSPFGASIVVDFVTLDAAVTRLDSFGMGDEASSWYFPFIVDRLPAPDADGYNISRFALLIPKIYTPAIHRYYSSMNTFSLEFTQDNERAAIVFILGYYGRVEFDNFLAGWQP